MCRSLCGAMFVGLLAGAWAGPGAIKIAANLDVAATGPVTEENATKWELVWSDEFAGAEGSLPDARKCKFDMGGGGWGNHELEYYTDRAVNASVNGGKLVITAQREEYAGADHVKWSYTSSRLKTQGLFAQTYG